MRLDVEDSSSTRCAPRRRAGSRSTSAATSARCSTGSSTACAPAGARPPGVDDVLCCLEEGRVDTLLLGEGFRASGVAERATEKALESSAEVVVVRHHDLTPHDGIAALLRY